ncbi:hypothetical protein [Spiroplasma endosymbiont of Polydrusus pterygomalis]|uniref:hypothetical protein n=1 Tax=Spiroplasma endosymbiont of Polydrusus pterygomalis TaxID=3139327 RepID=UPI003CCB4C6F
MFNFSRYNFNKENLLRKGKNKPHNKTENRGKVNNCSTIIERNIEFPNIKAINVFGHLEGDTIVGKNHKTAIITFG